MQFIYDDGGRAAAGFKGKTGACVARSIAIAGGLAYADVYAALANGMGKQRVSRGGKSKGATARKGISVSRKWFKDYMASIGATWTPTMTIGSGCKVHLVADELPAGRIICQVSKHYTAVVDGVIHDTFNPADRGTTVYPANYPAERLPKRVTGLSSGASAYAPQRCVYGYWSF